MIQILHCSDIHFGSGFQNDRLERLERHVDQIQPEAVVISGDLTMRATSHQFHQAAEFMKRIKVPLLVVPGNHDIPLFNLFRRFLKPFDRYRDSVHHDTEFPALHFPGVSLLGLNTVDPTRHQKGRITRHQYEHIEHWARQGSPEDWKLLVVHQHVQNAPGTVRPGRLRKPEDVVARLSDLGVHGLLYGHTHVPYVGTTAQVFPTVEPPLLLVNAPTATSRRARGLTKANGFHLLGITPDHIQITLYEWPMDKNGRDFHPTQPAKIFCRKRLLRGAA
jgi:3',5'-cyclic AMP phosphodiesterase CpdA